jgi:hypothetical protein
MLSRPFSRLKDYVWWRVGDALYKRRYRDFRPSYSSDAVVCGMDGYVASLSDLIERGNMEMFLKRLAELTRRLSSKPLWGQALFIPQLDELARKAGFFLASHPNSKPKSKLLVHVATEVFPIGGHSNVIDDIVAALPDYQHALIVTAMASSHPALVSMKPRFQELNLDVHLLKCSGWVEKATELSSLIGALAPRAVLMLGNYDDSVAYSAVEGDAAQRVLFLHHADHQPSLGASRTDYIHVDLTPACHNVCASRPDLHASLLNLTAKDIGTVQLTNRRPIIGVTCGSPYKYAGAIEFSYAQLVAGLFSIGVARLFHIGGMLDSQKDQICADIVANGQDSNRLIFLPNAPSLAAKLLEISPDFYLTSHPLGGGKATVEALSVGLPIVFVCPASRLPLLGPDMTFGTAIPVSTLRQVPEAIRRLEIEKSTLAKRSRGIYEEHYSMKAFREGLLRAINPDPNRS